jgi:hypothetical protein
MPRRHILAFALLALLAAAALAAPAQAKHISGLTACGADGCQPVERAIGQALHDLGGAPLAAAPANAPHFRLVLKIGDGHRTFGTDRVLYVPSRRAVGGDGGWTRIDTGSARKLAHALAGRTPLPAAALAKDVAALDPPGTSLPPEVFIPAASSATKASSAGGPSWWLLGAAALAAAAALAFIGNSHLRRR